jgi:uncharacterized protein (TIGR02246 family)
MVRCSELTFLAVAAATLAACTTKPDPGIAQAEHSYTEQSRADEAAIRQLLANVEKQINAGDLGFVSVFAKDAVIIAPSDPDVKGYDAIRALYEGIMKQASMTVHFSTEEVAVSGILAYEHGTYTLRIADKKTGKVLQDAKNKHVHIFKRQPDGSWKTWRMIVIPAEPASVATER